MTKLVEAAEEVGSELESVEVEDQVQGVPRLGGIVVVVAAGVGGCAALPETWAQPGE